MRTRVRTRSTPLSIWILRSLSARSRKRTPPRRKSRVEASQRRPWASRDAAKLENVKFTSNGRGGAHDCGRSDRVEVATHRPRGASPLDEMDSVTKIEKAHCKVMRKME